MLKKASILGHFGEGVHLHNGQTIKTKIVTEELKNQFGKENVLIFDTYGGWKTLLKAPFQVFKALKKSTNVIIFPAHNGLRVYAPLLSFFKRLFKKRKIHYVVIGGWLPEFVSSRKHLAKSLKRFDGIYVETNTMKVALENQVFCNVFILPNCKQLKILTEEEIVPPKNKPYKLCTFSRVMKEKGIGEAVEAIKTVNDHLGYTAFSLDIYGPIWEESEVWFESLQREFPEYVHYCGCVEATQSVDVLKNYFLLLFPTYYDGEGFAGTLIDAFSAGLPVIASDWKYNREIVNEKVGYVYPDRNQDAFVGILKDVALNPSKVLNKKIYCLEEAKKYRIDKAVQSLIERLI